MKDSSNTSEPIIKPPKKPLPAGFVAKQFNNNPDGINKAGKNGYAEGITQSDLDKLEGMTKGELIRLIKRVAGAMWGIGLMTKEEISDAAKLKLAIVGLTSENANSAITSLDKWLDRNEGRAVQSVAMKVEINPLEKMSTDRLLALEQEIASRGMMINVTPPMPLPLADDE